MAKKMARKHQELIEDTQTAPAAHAVDLRKTYGTGQAAVHALAGVSVTFERGRFTAVMGASGSGKSTLMQCMAGLDRPTSGQSFVGGLDIGSLDDAGLTQLRRDRIGFVFHRGAKPTLRHARGRLRDSSSPTWQRVLHRRDRAGASRAAHRDSWPRGPNRH